MRTLSQAARLLFALTAPLAVAGQWGGGGSGNHPRPPPGYQGGHPWGGRPVITSSITSVAAPPFPPASSTPGGRSRGGGGGVGLPTLSTVGQEGGSPSASTVVGGGGSPPASTRVKGGGGGGGVTSVVSNSQPTSSAGGGGGGGGGSSSCSGAQVINWSGDSVPWVIPGGATGMTTGCMSLNGATNVFVGAGVKTNGGSHFGSLFETNSGLNFDISYVTGYTVPIVCTSGSGFSSGCNVDLNGGNMNGFVANSRASGGSKDPGAYNGCASCSPWCYACSAPDPVFAPCCGSAYTFPYDDDADAGTPPTGVYDCCIGSGCAGTGREGQGRDGQCKQGHPETSAGTPCATCAAATKRAIDPLMEIFERYENDPVPPVPSLLRYAHKRSSHRHALDHDAKLLH